MTFGVPNVTYYYRFYVTNSAAEAWASPAASFVAGDVTIAATDPSAAELGADLGPMVRNLLDVASALGYEDEA